VKWLPGRSGRQGKIILAQGIADTGAAVLAEGLFFFMVVMQKMLLRPPIYLERRKSDMLKCHKLKKNCGLQRRD
jgi:hypothetical protein